jgi:hypothetical protein
MADSTTDAMNAVAAAVAGPDTPAAAKVTSAPDKGTALALTLAGPAISLLLVGCVAILTWIFWPDAMRLKAIPILDRIVLAVAAVAMTLGLMLGLVVFRLASGGLKKIEAKAGPGSVLIETGE